MTSVVLGLFAAIAWGVHDLLVRYLGPRLVISSALLTVLVIGTLASLPLALAAGGWGRMTAAAILLGALSGAFYAFACLGLYRAFAEGPVRLVAPIIGAYPILSVALVEVSGRPVAAGDWLAVAIIVLGVGLVARFNDPEDTPARRHLAIACAAFSGAGFAGAFALGHAAVRIGADWPVILTMRATAIAIVLALALALRRRILLPPRGQFGFLTGMGLLDGAALSLVTVSGSLPDPEFAAVTTSVFGVITVILARFILRERMSIGQWGSVAVVFSGVAMLGL